MDRKNWYFDQPVLEDEVDSLEGSTEDSINDHTAEPAAAFGVTSGLVPSSGAGVSVDFTAGVAITAAGRLLRSTGTINADLSGTDTDGGTIAVSAGNERYVAIFGRPGRLFSDARVDGDTNAIQFQAAEVFNAEGDTDPTTTPADTSKNASADKFYIKAGTEAAIGAGARVSKAVQTDLVLLCDVRITNGIASIAANDILQDRRDRHAQPSKQSGDLARSLFRKFAGAAPPLLGTARSALLEMGAHALPGSSNKITINNLRALLAKTSPSEFENPYVPVHIAAATVELQDGDGSNDRIDLIEITADGLNIVQGSPLATPTHPAESAGAIGLLDVLVPTGATDNSGWIVAPRRGRMAPWPFSEQWGIIEGCVLAWSDADPSVLSMDTGFVGRNVVLWDGEVIEFDASAITVSSDSSNDPFGSAPGVVIPYYIYLVRQMNANALYCPFSIVESLTKPDDVGTATVNGPRGSTTGMYIGLGYVKSANGRQKAYMDQEFVYAAGLELSIQQDSNQSIQYTLANRADLSSLAPYREEVLLRVLIDKGAANTAVLYFSAPTSSFDASYTPHYAVIDDNGEIVAARGPFRIPIDPGASSHFHIEQTGAGATDKFRFQVMGFKHCVRRIGRLIA